MSKVVGLPYIVAAEPPASTSEVEGVRALTMAETDVIAGALPPEIGITIGGNNGETLVIHFGIIHIHVWV